MASPGQRHRRIVIVKIDAISDMLKHYMDPEELPRSAAPTALQVHPGHNRKLAVLFESPEFVGESEQLIDIQLKRVYAVGGTTHE